MNKETSLGNKSILMYKLLHKGTGSVMKKNRPTTIHIL